MITVSNVITIDHPSRQLLSWCTKNLRLRNPEYDKKQRMHFWVGKTPEWLYLYEIHGDKLILPFGTLRSILPMVDIDGSKMDFPDLASEMKKIFDFSFDSAKDFEIFLFE